MQLQAYHKLRITAINEPAPGVKTFRLQPADGKPIQYRAGQFLTFVIDHHGKEERRSFSISSAPALGEPLTISVKRVDNGVYSRYLHDKAKVGDILQCTGAAGLFTLPDGLERDEQVFFFAAGIGITPIFSLIKELLHERRATKAVLIYSNPSAEHTAFKAELDALEVQYSDRFQIDYLYSSSYNLARARLNKALVPVLMQEYSFTNKNNILCYVCGPYAYMRMVIYALEEYGIPHDSIRRENFNTEIKPVIKAEPPDRQPHLVTVLHDKQKQTFTCQYPDTILQAAKKNNVTLPYSCETGRCGSCAAICSSGTVWHSYNEVLMDIDLRHGSILTCTGYPVDGDIVIEV